ncbi:MAG TPA: C4-dicarboxylate ABC transporter permease, partial [Terriglobia bacterium]|nr:C4-dicarboxylate ABC transporter permease [Terriglobia bacterium]
RTMMLTWKYTLPAFLVPFVFTLNADGMGILLEAPAGAIALSALTAAAGVAALAIGAAGWLRRRTHTVERVAAVAAGLLLMYPGSAADAIGLAVLAGVIGTHLWRTRANSP